MLKFGGGHIFLGGFTSATKVRLIRIFGGGYRTSNWDRHQQGCAGKNAPCVFTSGSHNAQRMCERPSLIHDVIHKTGSTKRIATPQEENRATTMGNMHKYLVKIESVVLKMFSDGLPDTRADRQTDRQTDTQACSSCDNNNNMPDLWPSDNLIWAFFSF